MCVCIYIYIYIYTHTYIHTYTHIYRDFPGGSVVKNPPAMQESWLRSLSWENPLEEEMATYSSILAWKIHGGVWWGTVHRVIKESDTT